MQSFHAKMFVPGPQEAGRGVKLVGIGIIGCGGMGRLHSRSIKTISGAQIVAAADAEAGALASYAEEFAPKRTYSSYVELLQDDDVDAVVICLPTFLHKDAVVKSAEAGKQVLCEKPIAMTVADARTMIESCDRADVAFMMGFVRRFDNDWGTFKRLIEEGAIGQPVVWRHIIAVGGPSKPWYLDKDKGGGPIIDGAIHDIDFANWLFGEVAWTEGVARHFKATAFDTATVCIGYENGAELLLSWTWGLPAGTRGLIGQDAIGPGGAILFPGSYSEADLPVNFDTTAYGAYVVDTGSNRRVEKFEKADMFLREMEHFVECCRTGSKPLVTGEDGLRALNAALTALEAARHI